MENIVRVTVSDTLQKLLQIALDVCWAEPGDQRVALQHAREVAGKVVEDKDHGGAAGERVAEAHHIAMVQHSQRLHFTQNCRGYTRITAARQHSRNWYLLQGNSFAIINENGLTMKTSFKTNQFY